MIWLLVAFSGLAMLMSILWGEGHKAKHEHCGYKATVGEVWHPAEQVLHSSVQVCVTSVRRGEDGAASSRSSSSKKASPRPWARITSISPSTLIG